MAADSMSEEKEVNKKTCMSTNCGKRDQQQVRSQIAELR